MEMTEFLYQGEIWIARDGREVKIKDMPEEWRKHSAGWLVNHASELWTDYRRVIPSIQLTEVMRLISRPDEVMRTTPLYLALTSN